jgi:hypothetical protein
MLARSQPRRVTALDENGVTGRQLRDTMKNNFMLYLAIARGQQPVPSGSTSRTAATTCGAVTGER